VRRERCRYPDLEARLWLIGQAVSAQAALELLAARARPGRQPWPEFAEYDCAACHHHLRAQAADKVPPRLLPWNNWYSALPDLLAGAGDPLPWPDVRPSLDEMRKRMSQPQLERDEVAAEASKAARLLSQPAATLACSPSLDAAALRRLFEYIRGRSQEDLVNRWDGATQTYLALAALHQAMADLDPAGQNPGERDALQALAGALRFPPGSDSPAGFNPEAVRQLLKALPR
jgi:hypothetical protein